jgi:hypothetical protein
VEFERPRTSGLVTGRVFSAAKATLLEALEAGGA